MLRYVTCAVAMIFFCSAVVWDNNPGQASVSMSPALAKANDLAAQHHLRVKMLPSCMSYSRDLVR